MSELQLQADLDDARVGKSRSDGTECRSIENARRITERRVIPGVKELAHEAQTQPFTKRRNL